FSFSRAGRSTGLPDSHERDAVRLQDLADLRLPANQDRLQLLLERLVFPPHAHRNVVHERKEREVDAGRDRHELERDRLLLREVTRDRTPRDRHIHVPPRHRLDQPGRRVRLRIVTVDTVADDVLDDLPPPERVRRRAVVVVVPDDVDADLQLAEDRVIQGSDLVPAILPVDEHVSGPVVRPGGEHELVARRHAHHQVALLLPQRVADEPAALRPPRVAQRRAELTGDELGELVLESFVSVVGVGEVVRIRAHPELPHLLPPHLPRNEQRRERRQQDGPPQRPRSPILPRSNCHRTRFHGPACGCRPSPRIPTDRSTGAACRAKDVVDGTSPEPAQNNRFRRRAARAALRRKWRAPGYREKTYSMPPLVTSCFSGPNMFTAPSAAVGSSSDRSCDTVRPAQPPTPARIAMYCLPSGPM